MKSLQLAKFSRYQSAASNLSSAFSRTQFAPGVPMCADHFAARRCLPLGGSHLSDHYIGWNGLNSLHFPPASQLPFEWYFTRKALRKYAAIGEGGGTGFS
eukprot:EG_transcript_45775